MYQKINNKIEWSEYHWNFIRWQLPRYYRLNKSIEDMQCLDWSKPEKVKPILNKAHYGSKESEMDKIGYELNTVRTEMFKWLDTLTDPYLYLLNPYYEFMVDSNSRDGEYRQNDYTGLNNIDLALEYLKHKLDDNISE